MDPSLHSLVPELFNLSEIVDPEYEINYDLEKTNAEIVENGDISEFYLNSPDKFPPIVSEEGREDGVWLSLDDYNQISEVYASYDQLCILVNKLRDSQKIQLEETEFELSTLRNEIKQAYELRMSLNTELIREKESHKDLKIKYSTKLSELQILRNEHTTMSNIVTLSKEELDVEKKHTDQLSLHIEELNERLSHLLETNNKPSQTIIEAKLKTLDDITIKLKNEVRREQQQNSVLKKTIKLYEEQLEEMQSLLLKVQTNMLVIDNTIDTEKIQKNSVMNETHLVVKDIHTKSEITAKVVNNFKNTGTSDFKSILTDFENSEIFNSIHKLQKQLSQQQEELLTQYGEQHYALQLQLQEHQDKMTQSEDTNVKEGLVNASTLQFAIYDERSKGYYRNILVFSVLSVVIMVIIIFIE